MNRPFLDNFSSVSQVSTTIPTVNGDTNPYGVVVVRRSVGDLVRGDILVSNFNNSAGDGGTGSTIVEISPTGTLSLFAQISSSSLGSCGTGGVGLTTALTILDGRWVVVGSLPTTAGDPSTAQAGCLIVLDSEGNVQETLAGNGINGPWDLTALQQGNDAYLFVTNVLNGTVAGDGSPVYEGTVLRLHLKLCGSQPPQWTSTTEIGSGFGEETSEVATVVGPTGVGLGANGTLYVADTLANRIAAIPNAVYRRSSAGTGRTVSENGELSGPLGLAIAPNGDILTANGGNGYAVEITPWGYQVAEALLDNTPVSGEPNGFGALFGLAVAPGGRGLYFVDDITNSLDLFH